MIQNVDWTLKCPCERVKTILEQTQILTIPSYTPIALFHHLAVGKFYNILVSTLFTLQTNINNESNIYIKLRTKYHS